MSLDKLLAWSSSMNEDDETGDTFSWTMSTLSR